MFAGPNGSGKSTLKRLLPKELLGVYLNPDDREKELRKNRKIDLRPHGLVVDHARAESFFSGLSWMRERGLTESI